MEGVRKVVAYTRASAPWVMGVRFSEEKGAGSVCKGREVGGFGGGEMDGTGQGSVMFWRCAGARTARRDCGIAPFVRDGNEVITVVVAF